MIAGDAAPAGRPPVVIRDWVVSGVRFHDEKARAPMPFEGLLLDLVGRQHVARAAKKGTIAFSPVPYFATYAATKAYVLHYTEALAVELRGTGVHALAVCPGPVRTEFESVAGNGRFQRSIPNLAASRVADATLSAWDRGRTVAVVGAVNRLITWFNGLLPRAIVRSMMGKLARPTTVSLPPGLESHR